MARTGFYNQSATAVIIDNQAATDLGGEFAYSIEFPDSLSTVTVGTERAVTNFTTNKTVTLNISLLPQSVFNDVLLNIYYDQQRGQAREFDATIYSTEGEKLGFGGCSVRQAGTIQGGGAEGVPRQYVLNVKEFTPDKSNF